MLDKETRDKILKAQKNEVSEYILYKKLAKRLRGENKQVLEKIARQELAHYRFWSKITEKSAPPSKLWIYFYYTLSFVFGINFGLRIMELGERSVQELYKDLKHIDEHVAKIIKEEEDHEGKLLELLERDKLKYTGSVILGLNDALVELTGVLAGLTFALQKTSLIAVVGLITGVAASLSMAGSEYLSSKEEKTKNPVTASIVTGTAYFITVFILIIPFFIFKSPYISFAVTLTFALIIIVVFNFYISVVNNEPFQKKFIEMAAISLGVAVLNFLIGTLVRWYFEIDV